MTPRPAHAHRPARPLGQALVEFALIAPLMMLLVVVGLDVGRMFFSWIEINNTAREGAAYAAGDPTDSTGISAHAAQEANSQGQGGEGSLTITTTCADPAKVTIACSTAIGGGGTGNTVTVRATKPFSFVTPLVGNVLGSSVTLTGSATAAVYGLQPNGGDAAPDACDPPSHVAFTDSASGMTVTLDAGASTPNSGRCAIASYNWDLGDGLDPFPPVVGKLTSYTYATAGTWTITLSVSNPGGELTTTATVTVPVAPSPTPSVTPTPTPTATPSPSPTTVCTMVPTFTYNETGNSGEFNFYGAYTGQPAPEVWYWTYGNGNVGFGQAPPRHEYGGPGPYTVTLTITNGSCQASTTQDVTP